MKILYLCGDLKLVGGIEKYNKDFIEALKKEGAGLHIVERYKGGARQKISFIFRSLAEIVIFKPDLIICAHLHFSPIVLIGQWLHRSKYVISLYGIECIKIQSHLQRTALNRADKLIVISRYTKDLISKQFNFVEDKYYSLPSCVDEEKLYIKKDKNLFTNQLDLGSGPIILTLSRLSDDEEKGQHRVLMALPDLCKKFPSLKYIIAGPGSDKRVDAILIQHPEIKKHIIRLGRVNEEEKFDLYNHCDVFILLSKNEGFGIVFIEALACGAQVIASDGFGCKEALLSGRVGTTVDPDNIDEVKSALNLCIERSVMKGGNDRHVIREMSLDLYGKKVWLKNIKLFLKIWD